MVFKGSILGGGHWNSHNPYLNSITILFDYTNNRMLLAIVQTPRFTIIIKNYNCNYMYVQCNYNYTMLTFFYPYHNTCDLRKLYYS